MQIEPKHISAGLVGCNELQHSTCLQCLYTGPTGVKSRTKRFGTGTLARVGVGLLTPLAAMELYMQSIGGAGVPAFYFLVAAAVPYGLSLVENTELTCPNCTSAIHL